MLITKPTFLEINFCLLRGTVYLKKNIFQGEYRVNLPDGRVQVVTYVADHQKGYMADVSYQGEPVYPPTQPNNNAPQYSYSSEPTFYG